MTHASNVATFVAPIVSLTKMQQSVIGFLDSTHYGIASSPRQTGMTFALHAHIVYMLDHTADRLAHIVFPSIPLMRHAIMELQQFMTALGNMDHIKFTGNSTTMSNLQSNTQVYFRTIHNINHGTFRGMRTDSVIFADFDGYGPYSREIQHKLPEMLSALGKNDATLHMIGTDNNSYVSNAHDDTSLLYAAMNGKSHFALWNYQLSTMVDDMLTL